MALSKRMRGTHDDVFPYGAFLVGQGSEVGDHDRSTREMKYQQVDKDTGLPLWQVDVIDADPEAKRASKTLSIKFAAKVQPVPPSNDSDSPFTPVLFEGMTALPYVAQVTEGFSRIAWSFGRLMPTGVTGPESPVSVTTSMALATMPVTLGLRYCGSQGIRSSNHWALSASVWMRAVFSWLT